MTEREKHIEMAQRLGLVGMRPHLDGIYIDALAAFARLVADDARATPEPIGDPTEEMVLAGIAAANRQMPYINDGQKVLAIWKAMQARATPALPQGVEEWMPILGTCLAIPMKLLDESQAKSNHGQTPARLKERGGISLSEAVAIAGKMKWRSLESKRALEILHDLSGMAIVPVEPTRTMCKAATSYTHSHDAMLIYKAMLAAAAKENQS